MSKWYDVYERTCYSVGINPLGAGEIPRGIMGMIEPVMSMRCEYLKIGDKYATEDSIPLSMGSWMKQTCDQNIVRKAVKFITRELTDVDRGELDLDADSILKPISDADITKAIFAAINLIYAANESSSPVKNPIDEINKIASHHLQRKVEELVICLNNPKGRNLFASSMNVF